ncbi:LysR family transcriptional regulator [Catenuloplanes indicus]|uniref:DNA-binding transcriptional LysR family regulator n=1 Tax=Catenuloplanes indicus TaxID=137267 RepID=A0AAE3W8L1_9ACTN|nr:LysR family transcriptional regulator [Catenuloplanes indicus]MDQ0371514.1 DNA-binding transcriptional LysR family regulator [Catenuloplanes indicus]
MSGLETRQLRYFVAVAEERHFGRAATRLGMAQPPLSRAIRDLERQLGVPLLVRTTRQVTLTPAGETLLADARVALDAISTAEHRARRAVRPVLRLALKADFDGGLLPAILDAYAAGGPATADRGAGVPFERSPGIVAGPSPGAPLPPVELLLGGPGDQERALRDGRADVALLPGAFEARGLDAEPLLTGPTVVALAAADPLAARTVIRLPDLAGRRLPYGSPAEQGRVAPPAAPRLRDLSQIFSLVEVGSAVWFLPEWVARRFPRPGIAYRPVPDLEPVSLSVVWPASSRSPAVAAFVRAARTVADSQPAAALH